MIGDLSPMLLALAARRVAVAATVAACLCNPVSSAPPPPPPAFVVDIGTRLKAVLTASSFSAYAADFADDVQVSLNGAPLSNGKSEWLGYQKARIGLTSRRVLGEAESYDSILIIDVIDDRFGIPSSSDSRYVVRATRYAVGSDRRIHQVQVLTGGSYFQ